MPNKKNMARTVDKFELQVEDREFLNKFTESGTAKAREVKRALALLELDRGLGPQQIANEMGYSRVTVYALRSLYKEEGLQCALQDKPRSGRPPQVLGADQAKITALACSDAPQGHAKWTLRLLADKAVELGYIEKGDISHTHVGRILKKTNSNRT